MNKQIKFEDLIETSRGRLVAYVKTADVYEIGRIKGYSEHFVWVVYFAEYNNNDGAWNILSFDRLIRFGKYTGAATPIERLRWV